MSRLCVRLRRANVQQKFQVRSLTFVPCVKLLKVMLYQANTFNASATLFETLVDVDTKFARFADHQSEDISNISKKWFKRLAVSDNIAPIHRRSWL